MGLLLIKRRSVVKFLRTNTTCLVEVENSNQAVVSGSVSGLAAGWHGTAGSA